MSQLEIATYELLKAKLGEQEAKTLLEFLTEQIRERSNAQREGFVSKDEMKKIEADIRKEDTRIEILIKQETAKLENRLVTLETRLDAKIDTRSAELESRVTRQIFFANLVQLLATLGGLIAILKFMLDK